MGGCNVLSWICGYSGKLQAGASGGNDSGEVYGIQTTQEVLVGNAILMVIPSVMVFLSLTLKAKVNRWANIILGMFFTDAVLITFAYYYVFGLHTWAYSYVFATREIVLCALIVWYAWKWPKQKSQLIGPV